jgi:hypothetical protein
MLTSSVLGTEPLLHSVAASGATSSTCATALSEVCLSQNVVPRPSPLQPPLSEVCLSQNVAPHPPPAQPPPARSSQSKKHDPGEEGARLAGLSIHLSAFLCVCLPLCVCFGLSSCL